GTFDNDDLLARVHPDDVERVRREFVQAIADGTGAVEYRFRCKNGDYRWLADYFVAQKDEAGRAMYLTGSIRDITGLKQTERALRNSERRFRKLFEADLMGVFITTPDGTFLDCNDAMVKMLRYDSREELIQCRSSDLYVDPEFRRDAIRVLRTEGVYLGREGRIRRKDGSIAYLLGAAVLLQDEETGEPYVQGVAVDITERKQAEEALRELTQTLESKVAERTAELQRRAQQLQKIMIELLETEDRERTRLAEVLHDDLQQELAAVKFHIGLMKEQARLNPALEATAAEVEHMIKDAIDKSRSLSHELSPAIMHHGDFAETIRWLANEVQARHGLVVHVQIDGEVRVESHAIKSLLIRAVQELLFNVVKHAHVKEARIDVRQYDHRIGLSVSDFGRGFNPQSLEQTVGFGLLSIRERVQLLRGRMKIKSLPGRGSRFSIIVPAGEPTPASPSSETAPSPSIAEESHDGHRLRVLLADDHEIVRQGLVSLLGEEHSVQVVGEASNGREAVTLAERLDPDIVIMDVSMPVMGGEEATRSIKERLPHTRVVALSIIDDPGVREAMRAAGADAYVLKTASLDELLTAIRGESRTHDTLLTASPA
ncbi:MAG: PAS domain S-box protein, partial [Solirubrobacterales bacterium]